MRKLLFLLFATAAFGATGQSPNRTDSLRQVRQVQRDTTRAQRDRARQGGDCDQVVDVAAFSRLYFAQFSKLIDPASNNNVGNYAGLSIEDATATLGASSMFRDSSILSVKATGGVEDGVAAIWSNRKVNGGFSANVQYHLAAGGRVLYYNLDSCSAVALKRARLDADFLRKMHELRSRNDTVLAKYAVRTATARNAAMQADTAKLRAFIDSLDGVPAASRTALWTSVRAKKVFAKDSIAYALVGAELELALKRKEFERARGVDGIRLERLLGNWYAREKKKLIGDFGVEGARIRWWSFGYAYSASKFRLYNDSAAFGEQVNKASYGSHEVRIQHSWYHRTFLTKLPAHYYTIGVSAGMTDNHADLDEVTLEERTQQGPDSLSRTEIANYKALEGAYEKDLLTASVFAEAYWFAFRNKSTALHLFPSYTVMDKTTPRFDLGVGLFAGFANAKTPGNAVNVEVYVLFNDMGNGASADSDAWGRSNLGLRVAFPFNFPQKP